MQLAKKPLEKMHEDESTDGGVARLGRKRLNEMCKGWVGRGDEEDRMG